MADGNVAGRQVLGRGGRRPANTRDGCLSDEKGMCNVGLPNSRFGCSGGVHGSFGGGGGGGVGSQKGAFNCGRTSNSQIIKQSKDHNADR